jgi:hypothetical protein
VVIVLQSMPSLPSYVRSLRETPDEVFSILSVVVGAGASTLPAPPLCAVFFCCFGGDRPLHKAQSLIFNDPTEDPSSRFEIYSLKVFPNIRPAVFSFLSCRCRLVFGSFTPVLPSRSTRRLFPNVHPFRVPLVNFYLVCFFRRPCSTDGPS